MMRRCAAVFACALLLSSFAPRAEALFHLAVLDEVLTSYGGNPNEQFIEVRMLAGSQNLVANSVFAAFDNTGAYVGDLLVVPSNVANSGAGTRWLIGTSAFQSATGLAPDFVMPAGVLPTGGGMVCFGGGGGALPQNPPTWSRTNFGTYVDCLAYGTYAGSTNTVIGTPTPLNGDGHSLQRIGASTHNNAADFTCGDPSTPQNNAGATVSMPATTSCGACPSSPDAGCVSGFAKGALLIKEAPDGKEKLLVKMVGGPALAQTDLGNPLSGDGTAYGVCIYDDTSALVGEVDVERAGDTCGSAPCWSALGGDPPSGRGYKYKDASLSADGVLEILYKAGAAGKSKALVKGRGAGLPDGIAPMLQSSTSATVQLRGSDAPKCLSLTVTDIKKHDPTFFKAKK